MTAAIPSFDVLELNAEHEDASYIKDQDTEAVSHGHCSKLWITVKIRALEHLGDLRMSLFNKGARDLQVCPLRLPSAPSCR